LSRVSKDFSNLKNKIDEELIMEEEELTSIDLDSDFLIAFENHASCCLTDSRDNNYVYHSMESVLLIVIFGIMANCNNFVEVYHFMNVHKKWIEKNITLDYGLPSLSTIKRVIGMIIPNELEVLCNTVLYRYFLNEEPYYKDDDLEIKDLKAIDGKTCNSSDRKSSANGEIPKVNAMSLVSIKRDMCEATKFISDKTNEIPTGPELLKMVNIENCIILFDAMSTQTETIKCIVENKAYYIAPVKGNQSTLEENIKLFLDDESNYKIVKDKNYLRTIEKAHGSAETRTYTFTNEIDWLENKDDWLGLKSIGKVKREYTNKNGEEVTDTRYFISNLDANKIKILSTAIRKEWHIENGLHLYLDMVFNEDKNKCFLNNSQKNLNLIRKFVLALLKRYKITTKDSMNIIRFDLSMDFEKSIDRLLKKIY